MARAIYQYQPWNETPDVAVGVKLPFNKAAHRRTYDQHYASGSRVGGGLFVQTYSTEEQAVTNFRNLLMTHKGERVMQPNFGISIRKFLFEQNTETLAEFLTEEINEGIDQWLPYINLREIDVTRDINLHTIRVYLKFTVTTTGANMVINILANENQLVVSEATSDAGVTSLQQVVTFGGGSMGGFGGGGY